MHGGEPIDRLMEIGLTMNEARCYLALLKSTSSTAAEVAAASGVPRPKVYTTLRNLEQRGFCMATGSDVTHFRAVDPDLALAEWVRSRVHQRSLLDERERRSADALAAVLPTPPPGDDLEGSNELGAIMRLMHGPGETTHLLQNMLDGAETRVDIIVATPVFQPRSQWNVHELAAVQRGVRVRLLVPSREFADLRDGSELARAGVEVRAARNATLKMLIRDGSEAIVTLSASADAEPSVVSIRHADLIAPLQLMFNREWRRALPLYE